MVTAFFFLGLMIVTAWISGYMTCKVMMEYRSKVLLQRTFEESRKQKIRELYGDSDDKG